MTVLDARFRRLEDRAETEDLVVTYFLAADDDGETLGRTFAVNGSFSAGGFPGGSDRESVARFVQTNHQNMGVTVHTQNTTLITLVDDDPASGVVGAHLRTPEGGKFGSREMASIHVGPWDEVGASLTVPNRAR